MTEPPPVIEFADHVLGRLAGLDLAAAEHVHAFLLETTEPEEVADLACGAPGPRRPCFPQPSSTCALLDFAPSRA